MAGAPTEFVITIISAFRGNKKNCADRWCDCWSSYLSQQILIVWWTFGYSGVWIRTCHISRQWRHVTSRSGDNTEETLAYCIVIYMMFIFSLFLPNLLMAVWNVPCPWPCFGGDDLTDKYGKSMLTRKLLPKSNRTWWQWWEAADWTGDRRRVTPIVEIGTSSPPHYTVHTPKCAMT
jgi:hypothetical protein